MTTNRQMTSREQIAFNREAERRKAEAEHTGAKILQWLTLFAGFILASAFAAQCILLVFGAFHLSVGFSVAFLIAMILFFVVIVGGLLVKVISY